MLNVSWTTIGRISAVVALVLVAVACGGDSSTDAADASSSTSRDATVVAADEPSTTTSSPTTTGSTTATSTTTTTRPPSTLAGGLVASSVRTGLGFIDYDNNPLQTLKDIDVLSDEQRDIVIHFYKVGDRYAAVYEGLDPDTAGCVMMSVTGQRDGEEFAQWHYTRAALANGHCHQFPDEIPNTEVQGVQLCNGRVAFLSSFLVEEGADGLHAQIDFLDLRPGGIIGGGGAGMIERFVVNEALPTADIEQISC